MESNCDRFVMHARVLEANSCDLLVCDLHAGQQILVHAQNACRFCPGDCVCIEYSGAMTASIPPQISAHCVRCINQN